jgi:hypothetical protein
MADMRNAYRLLDLQLKGKKLLERPRHRWANIKMDLR